MTACTLAAGLALPAADAALALLVRIVRWGLPPFAWSCWGLGAAVAAWSLP